MSYKNNKIIRRKTSYCVELEVYVVDVYLIFIYCLLPLIYRNNYIDIQTYKYQAFRIVTLAAIIVLLFLYSLEKVLNKFSKNSAKNKTTGEKNDNKSYRMYQLLPILFLLLFAAVLIISTVTSLWPHECWTGERGRLMGTEGLLLCIGGALAVAYRGRINRYMLWAFAAVNTVAAFIGILNFWGIDILKMYINLNPVQHSFFIGTIGNKNVTSNYLCLIAPAALGLFYLSKQKTERILLSVFSVSVVYYGFAASSDSFLLGCAGAALIMLCFSLTEHQNMLKFFNCCVLFYISAWLMKLSLFIARVREIESPFLSNYPTEGLIPFCLSLKTLIISGIVFIVLVIAEHYLLSKKSQAAYRHVRKCVFLVLLAAGIVLAVLICVANRQTGSGFQESSVLRRLVIPDSFGSNRGYIWRKSIELFADSSIKQKIIGSGPGTFYYAADAAFGAEMRALYGDPFIDAHCEFLQFLVTTGIVGVIGYFGAQISAVRVSLSNSVTRPSNIIFGAMILSFLFQGIVNNPTVFATPQMFAVLGLIISKTRRN